MRTEPLVVLSESRRPALIFAALLVMTAAGAGCASVSKVKREPVESGLPETYKAPQEEVVRQARESLVAVGYEDVTSERLDGNWQAVFAKLSGSMQSWGHWVRVLVSPTTATGETSIRVAAAKRIEMNATEDTVTPRMRFVDELNRRLRSGRPADTKEIFGR
jgi:hypothetical protein